MSALPHQSHPHTPTEAPRARKGPPPLRNVAFLPPEDQIDPILDRILDPRFSLTSIAFDYETTLPALNLWLSRPDIDERLRALDSICARRSRLIAANALPSTVTTLTRILEEYNEDEYLNPGDATSRENKRRWHETARKTAALLFRIATYDPTRPRAARASQPVRSALETPSPHPHYWTTTTTTADPSFTFATTFNVTPAAPHAPNFVDPKEPLASARDAAASTESLPSSSSDPAPTSAIPHPTSDTPLALIRQVGASPGYGADLSQPADPGSPHPITGLHPPVEDNAHLYPPLRERDHAAWVRRHGEPVRYYASQPNHPQHAAAIKHLANEPLTPKEPLASARETSPSQHPAPPTPTPAFSLKSEISNSEISSPNPQPNTPVPLTISAKPRAP